MYALIKYGVVQEYPLSIYSWRIANPNVSLPAQPTEAQLNEQGIYSVVDVPPPVVDPLIDAVDDAGAQLVDGIWTHVWNVRPATEAEIAAAMQEIQTSIIANTQSRLDTFAQTRNYDGILSACTYATSTVPKFQVEGQYCVDARDQTWATLYQIMAEVQAGTRPMPRSFADVEPDLPVLAWPA